MSKEVLLLFQDCPYCKPREKWGKRQMKLAAEHNIVVRETRYDSPGAAGLIADAKNHGISTLPFFTDGIIFAQDLSAFVKERSPVPAPKDDEVIEPEKKTAKRSTHKKAVEKVETDDPVGQD